MVSFNPNGNFQNLSMQQPPLNPNDRFKQDVDFLVGGADSTYRNAMAGLSKQAPAEPKGGASGLSSFLSTLFAPVKSLFDTVTSPFKRLWNKFFG